ncbi:MULTISPECIES: hypothetical protein [Streptomyces]|jgi:hypothetical protein|uniref:Uncharacterized protein n=3 Tax=Streptomyces griseoaurantiacus TaxID=68213 RepID=F3NJS9_9ACTN|nr:MULTISPECIES: hypothetical protein [Streptomyces]EGG46340.1 hypothetical protein SGM_3393 [Streptomyces griseoaurantiacus M045]MBA5220176.1 hypothetical protein [Streptomyces griseoaurantiacus]MCF0088833.1 hypothetical protein [Streptomyces sp. MH192]MCF0100754.1 hypothetical protein [Streptomyces sp. MH191]MDX3092510.1 hypothetical protein [Streptomyces sp. ME12-02E]
MSSHDIGSAGPTVPGDAGRRDVRPTDEEFYASDRPANPALPEDRPRGGVPGEALRHRGTWSVTMIVLFVLLVLFVGIWAFP